MIHTDDRRTLIDWGGGTWKSCKTIYVKSNIEIGNHYHKIKHERFMLVKGNGFKIINGEKSIFQKGEVIDIPPGTLHTFILEPDSILIGLCSHAYNENDDYK